MKLNWIVVKSGEIESAEEVDTETMDADRLAAALDLIKRATESYEPIYAIGAVDDPVVLGVGMAPIDWLEDVPEDEREQLLDSIGKWKSDPWLRKSQFFLEYQGQGPSFQLIPENTESAPEEILGSIAGTRFHDYVYNGVQGPESLEDKEREREHFAAVAERVWELRPAVFATQPWSRDWNNYAMYLGAAMFLLLEENLTK